MYVHKDAKLIFLANPRTGSTSVAKALMDIGFKQLGPHHSTMKDTGVDYGWTTFAVVRNHWDAAVSWVFGKHLGEYKDLDFTIGTFEFALDNEYVTEHEMWGYHKPDLLVRYEFLELDLDIVLHTLGLGPVKLPKENVSKARNGRHYREFYTDETRDYIGNRFKGEIERLGYEF